MSQPLNPNRSACFNRDKTKESSKPYLLFDAGGTLVFPDQVFLIQQAKTHGIELTQEQLFNGYYDLIYTLDYWAHRQGNDFPDAPLEFKAHTLVVAASAAKNTAKAVTKSVNSKLQDPWPQGYVCALLESIGIGGPVVKAINRAAQARHKQKSLWTFTFPWISETLDRLAAQGYRMSVISNSEKCSIETLRGVDLARYLDRIFYSAQLGVAKPDPRIFEKALHELNLQPADTLYIGDIFEVDVRGANAAGIGGIHLGPGHLYRNWPGVHLPDVRHLPNWLASYADTPSAFDLFPFERQSQVNAPIESIDRRSARHLITQLLPARFFR